MYTYWNTVQEAKDENSRAALIAMGLNAWATCMAGHHPPEYFGDMMVILGKKLGITPIPQEFERMAKEITESAET